MASPNSEQFLSAWFAAAFALEMMTQHPLSPLSHTPVRRHLESPWDLASMGGLGSSMKPWNLLVADASISGISWSSSPILSTTEQQGNRIYPRTMVGQGTELSVYNTQLGHFPKHHPTLCPSDETPAQQSPYSLLYATPIPGPQTRVQVPEKQFVKNVDSMTYRALRNPVPCFDIHTSQFPGWTDHGRKMSEGANIPMMPLSDVSSCTPTCSTSGASVPQEGNGMSRRKSECEHLASALGFPSQLFMIQDRGTMVEEMAEKPYQCSICRLSFSQRQGLTRHNKDTHLPKKRCAFCTNFAWSQGRRYIYRKHLEEEHPDFVLPSARATPIRHKRRIKLKGQLFHEISIAPLAS